MRELHNVIERAMIHTSGKILVIESPAEQQEVQQKLSKFAEVVKEYIIAILERLSWKGPELKHIARNSKGDAARWLKSDAAW
ncbi:MAG: hypothetical protein OSB65_01005 [Roseibacillus sp.]|nr:hypothetical protein [Roseibacillus sp.]